MERREYIVTSNELYYYGQNTKNGSTESFVEYLAKMHSTPSTSPNNFVPVIEGYFSRIDLTNANFRGCKFKEVKFGSCNFAQASFNDTDLSEVTFDSCTLNEADMRGTNLGSTTITSSKKDDYTKFNGIKFSFAGSDWFKYTKENKIKKEENKKTQRDFEIEKKNKLSALQEKIDAEYKKMSSIEAMSSIWGGGSEEYNKLLEQKKQIEDIYFTRKPGYTVSQSILDIVESAPKISFDPLYKTGDYITSRQYIPLNREEITMYLAWWKENKNLTIEQYTKTVAGLKNIKIDNGATIVPDCSYLDGDNPVDLSEINFSMAKISGLCLMGANLNNTKPDANIIFVMAGLGDDFEYME